jgi:hypothetical protein
VHRVVRIDREKRGDVLADRLEEESAGRDAADDRSRVEGELRLRDASLDEQPREVVRP